MNDAPHVGVVHRLGGRDQQADRGGDRQRAGPQRGFQRAALEEILRTSRERGICTGVVLMPERSDLRSCYATRVLKEVKHLLDDLDRRYGAALIDARSWIGAEGFRDPHHLLAAGAEQFSDRLARETLPALLRVKRGAARGPPAAGAGG